MMKKSWIPAALMGALFLGYLMGSDRVGSRGGELPPEYETPPASAPTPMSPPPLPVDPPAIMPAPAPVPPPEPADGLDEYPAWNGVDLDCKDVRRPVRVTGPDPHRLDQDGNGIGCESY
ncbi:MAG TPA: hypothetical protein VF006_07400 [Longimicrobium sp.]